MKLNKIIILVTFILLVDSVQSSEIVKYLKLEEGFKIHVFAKDIDSPRQMAEGVDGTIYVGSRRAGKVYALRDADRNGIIDSKMVIAENLTFSTGVSLHKGDLYFSEINKIWKIENIRQQLNNEPSRIPEKILVNDSLPDDEWHGWKWLRHDDSGRLHTNIGAPCNVCISDDSRHATIVRLEEGKWNIVARGVRNSVGFDFHPISKKLYFTDNGRDWLGDDSPSCELNKLESDGQFFGFPYKHASDVLDPDFQSPNLGFSFIDPIAELGAHVAPTGVTFYKGDLFPDFKNNLFITLHGSWNRSSKVGYKVIRVVFDSEGNVKEISDFITGWLKDEKVLGRPAAPFELKDGSLLISDDKANLIYKVTRI